MVAVAEPHSGGTQEAIQGIARAISRIQVKKGDAPDFRQDNQGQWSCRGTALLRREEIDRHRYATQEQPGARVRPAGRHRHLQDAKELNYF